MNLPVILLGRQYDSDDVLLSQKYLLKNLREEQQKVFGENENCKIIL